MTARPANRPVRVWLSAALVWLAAFLLPFATLNLHNDHFDRISRARQIAQYGELPFRDFFDPGYFMAELSSAALQRLLGDNLLSELLLDAAFIATGVVLVLLLAERASASLVAALGAAVLSLLTLPRLYDFDKVLFYPLGVLLCWRYLDRPVVANLLALAAGLVAGTSFRYDTGVYVGAAALVTVIAAHRRAWKPAVQRLALLGAAILCFASPGLVFIQLNGGVGNAADQVVTYARREGARTRLAALPEFSLVPPATVLPTHGDGEAPTRTPEAWHAANGAAFLYCLILALPMFGLLTLTIWSDAFAGETRQRIVTLAILCVTVDLFILRDPIAARVGGVAGPSAVLGAWLGTRLWRTRRLFARGAIVAVGALTIWAIAATADWRTELTPERVSPRRLLENLRALTAPAGDILPVGSTAGLVTYVRECTHPTDRVYASWFVPELYFYAARGFAAGMAVTFGGHWSEARYRQKMVDLAAVQSIPLAIVDTRSYDQFRELYPELDRHLRARCRIGGETNFGNRQVSPGTYRVLVCTGRVMTRMHPVWSLPCFR